MAAAGGPAGAQAIGVDGRVLIRDHLGEEAAERLDEQVVGEPENLADDLALAAPLLEMAGEARDEPGAPGTGIADVHEHAVRHAASRVRVSSWRR